MPCSITLRILPVRIRRSGLCRSAWGRLHVDSQHFNTVDVSFQTTGQRWLSGEHKAGAATKAPFLLALGIKSDFVAFPTGEPMPIYDYRCSDCNKTFELLVRMSAVPDCPECGSQKMEKSVSLPAPQGQTAGILSRARTQAAREGHFSHYKPSERPRT